MNSRQAAKSASKRIDLLEYTNRCNASDIKRYNACIDHMIAGGSPCDYCEDKFLGECPNPDKQEHGCDQWGLHSTEPDKEPSV